ncbi:hypothetical protein DJ533_08740 [Acinetobacter defluvii]|uniref:Uncharacterized protein n=1 Tax=Acinetobacter defluvii TaxID=1871111 RepID=A0A2S2FCW4_9GAMM|nr:hypothetical protein [Acinetobacter defluvii]AWL28645.1 hypothetical protein DJ533_08740 [Acinetobacter defluvii]
MNVIYQVELFHQQRLIGKFVTGNNFPKQDLSVFLQNMPQQDLEIQVYKGLNEKRILTVENGVTKVIATHFDFQKCDDWESEE